MIGENSGNGGCKFIAGLAQDIHAHGEAIYCRKQVADLGEAWCREHKQLVYVQANQRTGKGKPA